MADVHEPEVRSYNMSQIRGKNTKPEMLVRKFLHSNGFRYGLHNKSLPGKPDIVMRKYKTIIFIHGCFWHGHVGCKRFVLPKSNQSYWIPKIEANISRDNEICTQLRKSGWKIIIIWECELTTLKRKKTLRRLVDEIKIIDYEQRTWDKKTSST